jgi:hypothetical protein
MRSEIQTSPRRARCAEAAPPPCPAAWLAWPNPLPGMKRRRPAAQLSPPAGTKGSYRYERVSAAGAITVLNQGTWVSPLAEAQQVTFHVTYDAGGLPDAAMVPKADRPEGMLRALGVLMLLVAASVLIGTAGRKRELWRPGVDGRQAGSKRPCVGLAGPGRR